MSHPRDADGNWDIDYPELKKWDMMKPDRSFWGVTFWNSLRKPHILLLENVTPQNLFSRRNRDFCYKGTRLRRSTRRHERKQSQFAQFGVQSPRQYE